MNSIYFDTADDALTECEHLTTEDYDDSEDRATIGAFYNGQQTMTECEAEERGVSEMINHLFGYDSINSANESVNSIYTKAVNLWNIEVKNAPDGKSQEWSQKTTTLLNKAIKDSKRLKPEWRAMSGEVTLYGSFHFVFCDNYDWCPKARRPMVPRGTGTVPAEVPYAAVRDTIRLKDLYAYLRSTKRLSKKDLKTGWNVRNVQQAIDILEGNMEDTSTDTVNTTLTGTDSHSPTPEEAEMNRQMDTDNSERYKLELPVYYLFTSRPDEEGCPFDMTILARYPVDEKNDATRNEETLGMILFDKKRYYPKAKDFLHSFFIDCNIGGKTMWHRSMGLGRLNYDSDVDVEDLFNLIMQGSKDTVRRQYQVSNAADTETVNRWLSGAEYSSVLPEGVSVAEQAKNPNFQYAMGTMDILKDNSKRHGAASLSNGTGQRATNELEVQALERQGRNAEAIANRMNELYDCASDLGTTVFERFLNPSILESDAGYAEIKWFQDEMKSQGIPLAFLRQEKNGKLKNAIVKTNRSVGDGNSVKQSMVNASIRAMMPSLSPQAQEKAKRMIIASETQNYELADELVPLEQELDGGQINVANNENQTMIQRGITGYVSPLQPDDIPLIHIQEHIGGLEGLLGKGGTPMGWDELDMMGFQSIIKHLQQHMQAFEGNPENKQIANAINQKMQGLTRQAQEYANNLQAKRESEEQQMEPAELANLQLKGAEHELDIRKQDSLEEHRAESLNFSRQKAGVSSELQARQQNIQIDQTRAATLQSANQFDMKLQQEQEEAAIERAQTIAGNQAPQGNPNQ